jgi:hypothetical protein
MDKLYEEIYLDSKMQSLSGGAIFLSFFTGGSDLLKKGLLRMDSSTQHQFSNNEN